MQAAEGGEINDDASEDVLDSDRSVTRCDYPRDDGRGTGTAAAGAWRRGSRPRRTSSAAGGAGRASAGKARNLGRPGELRQPADASNALHSHEPLQARAARRLPDDGD